MEKEAASLLEDASVELFVERALLARPGFRLTRRNARAVSRICRRLDGIPLSLELAAARMRSLTVEEVDARLDDRFQFLSGGNRTVLPRQQTLRASLDWSYDLLSEPEKTLLAQLSVFSGGWTLEAAEQVCDLQGRDGTEERREGNGLFPLPPGPGPLAEAIHPSLFPDEVLDLLSRLVVNSLVLFEESLAIRRELRDTPGIASSLRNLGLIASDQGDLARAQVLHEQSLEILRKLGRKHVIADSLYSLGILAEARHNLQAAYEFHRESLMVCRDSKYSEGFAPLLRAFARLAAAANPHRACRLWGAEEAQREAVGMYLPPNAHEEYNRDLSAARETLGEATFAAAWAEGAGNDSRRGNRVCGRRDAYRTSVSHRTAKTAY